MNQIQILLVYFCCLGLGACSSQSSVPLQAAPSLGSPPSSGDLAARSPSVIDPAKSPVVSLSGILEGELVLGSSVKIKVDVANYPLDVGWQEARVVLNYAVVERLTQPSSQVEISSGLKEGLNRISVYLARSFNESIKTPMALSTVNFYYKKKEASLSSSGNAAGLILVSPDLSYKGEAARKIPFDFLVTNHQGRRYRVYYTLDGATREVSAEGAPYYFYNLAPGNHNLLLELIDSKGKPIKSAFGKTETQFRIE